MLTLKEEIIKNEIDRLEAENNRLKTELKLIEQSNHNISEVMRFELLHGNKIETPSYITPFRRP